MKRHLAIVLNPDSGKSETSKAEIKKLFSKNDVSLNFFDIKKGIEELTKRIAASKPQAVVAVGGDGTVNAVASIVAELNLPMAVIAAGTLNHFAKDMGLPLDPTEAASVIMKNKSTKVDHGKINNRIFVNNCNIGGYPETVLKRDKLSHVPSKWLAGILAAAHVGRQHRKRLFELDIDGKKTSVRAGTLFIGNNSYLLEGTKFTTRKKLNQGNLQLVVVKTGRFRHLVSIVIGIIFKQLHEKVAIHEAKQIQIDLKNKQCNVALDGEVIQLATPLRVTIHPKMLRVLV